MHNTNIPPRPELDRNLERVLDQNRAQLHAYPVTVPFAAVLRTRQQLVVTPSEGASRAGDI